MIIHSASFVKSSTSLKQCPESGEPEFGFIGRSNVGKSSLINMLTGWTKLAKISGEPGKTRTINHFLINGKWFLVDLPGYGYAKVPVSMKESWRPMIEIYLRERSNLRLVIIIADIRRDITDDERLLIDWLTLYGRPVILVLSKIDKLSKNQQFVRLKHVRAALNSLPLEDIIPYSAKTGEGKEKIWLRIEREHLGSEPVI